MKRFSMLYCISIVVFVMSCVFISEYCYSSELLSYIKKADNSYEWKKTDEIKSDIGTHVILSMTSQTWQNIPWKHTIDLYIPQKCEYPKTAVLIISGGDRNEKMSFMGELLSNLVKCPLAILNDIPNQPLCNGKYEDNLVAYTFCKFLETGDESWPLLFPMTKSAVRAMDTIQAYSEANMNKKIENFVVSGASKRGWTTWLTGAADPVRVKGIMPMVYDNLNLEKQMKLQIDAYGTYTLQINDYTSVHLQERANTPLGQELTKIIDPWQYRDLTTMPKLIINSTNDPYWALGSLNIYWDSLKGQKSIFYVTNVGHDLGLMTPDAANFMRIIAPMNVFVRSVATKKNMPKLFWSFKDKPENCIFTITAPNCASAKIWTASSKTKDFRQSVWISKDINPKSGKIAASLPIPKDGYKAFFGEVRFSDKSTPFSLCTQVHILNAKNTSKY